jgi:hypothetical protein
MVLFRYIILNALYRRGNKNNNNNNNNNNNKGTRSKILNAFSEKR